MATDSISTAIKDALDTNAIVTTGGSSAGESENSFQRL